MRKMIGVDEALGLVLAAARVAAGRELTLGEAHGQVAAEEVDVDRDLPPFDRAMMDGYAIRCGGARGGAEGAEPAGTKVRVVGELAAGAMREEALGEGEAVEIMTGASCPPGTEAVVPYETVQREAEWVALPDEIRPGQHIARRATTLHAGAPLVRPGDRLTPMALGALAAVGRERVLAIPRPRVAIIVTGDELAGATEAPGGADIRDSNGPMLAACARRSGAEVASVARAVDTPGALEAALEAAESAGADLVILTGGVSAGKYDLVPGALEARGVELIFHKVAQKPGKPLLFGVGSGASAVSGAGVGQGEGIAQGSAGWPLYFGLPGNPLSCFVCFQVYVATALRRLAGEADLRSRWRAGRLDEPVRVKGDRTLFVPALLSWDEEGAARLAPLTARDSGDIYTLHQAEALVRVEPGGAWARGDRASYLEL